MALEGQNGDEVSVSLLYAPRLRYLSGFLLPFRGLFAKNADGRLAVVPAPFQSEVAGGVGTDVFLWAFEGIVRDGFGFERGGRTPISDLLRFRACVRDEDRSPKVDALIPPHFFKTSNTPGKYRLAGAAQHFRIWRCFVTGVIRVILIQEGPARTSALPPEIQPEDGPVPAPPDPRPVL